MAFTKKTWVNVPDPSNPPDIPEGQDALARFDADNMNRIEEGINEVHENIPACVEHLSNKSNPHKVTPAQIGALSETKYISEVDILSVSTDGWYYTINCSNAPIKGNGYLCVRTYGRSYRVISWYQNSSPVEYVNILNNDTWLGWTKTFTDKGGVLTGNVEISKEDSPYITFRTNNGFSQILKNANDDFDGGIVLKDCSDTTKSSSYVSLNIKHANTKESCSFLAYSKDGAVTYYDIFGEHNRPAGDYMGAYDDTDHALPEFQQKREIQIGGVGQTLIIRSGHHTYIVGEANALVFNSDNQVSVTTLVRFGDGILYLDGVDANKLGAQFTYQAL